MKLEDRARALFLAAARAETLGGEPEGRAEVWERAAGVARGVGEEPIFLRFARARRCEALLSPAALADLDTQARYHAFRWEELREAAEAALRALAGAGIRPVLLKGLAAAGSLYDPPSLRPMRDLDILVRADELDRAETALRAGAFRESAGSPAIDFDRHHHLRPLFHEGTGACVEVHRGIAAPGGDLAGFPPPEEFRAGARPSPLFGGWADCPSPTGFVLSSCVHLTYADKVHRRAQNLVDLIRALDAKGGEVDWERLLRAAASPAAARSLCVPLAYLAREGLPTAPEPVRAELVRRARLRSWELALLHALTDRYRLGAPPPWRWISGRVSNVLWSQALRARRALARVRG
ncbi:MAG: nucleotidyltransferase family protein, partial [Planctomycetota bacterium]